MSESLESELRQIVRDSGGLFSIMLGTKVREGVVELKLTDDVRRTMDHYKSGEAVQIWAGDPSGNYHKILEFRKNKLEIGYFHVEARSDEHYLSRQEMKRALTDIYFPAYKDRKNGKS